MLRTREKKQMKTKGNYDTQKAAAAFKFGLVVFPGLVHSFFGGGYV